MRKGSSVNESGPLTVYTDGAARGNPGPAAIAYLIYDAQGNVLEKDAKYIGHRTNNEAEYEAIIWAIEKVRERSCGEVRIYSDSELVVKQVNMQYRTNDRRMEIFAARVRTNTNLFEKFSIEHVRRENPRTQIADKMVNDVLDREGR
jgi:ribonuclease HI